MRAVVYDRYGPPEVLRLADVERPIPKADGVLVKIHSTTVSRTDCATREANRRSGLAVSLISRIMTGLRRPRRRILGVEFSGVVETVGAGVSEFAVGDHVFGRTGFSLRGTRGVHLQGGARSDRAQADQYDVRGGCGGVRRSLPCARLSARCATAEGAADPRLRRVRGD